MSLTVHQTRPPRDWKTRIEILFVSAVPLFCHLFNYHMTRWVSVKVLNLQHLSRMRGIKHLTNNTWNWTHRVKRVTELFIKQGPIQSAYGMEPESLFRKFCFQNFPLMEAIYLPRLVPFHFNSCLLKWAWNLLMLCRSKALLTNTNTNFYSSPRLSAGFDSGPDSRPLSLAENKILDKQIHFPILQHGSPTYDSGIFTAVWLQWTVMGYFDSTCLRYEPYHCMCISALYFSGIITRKKLKNSFPIF